MKSSLIIIIALTLFNGAVNAQKKDLRQFTDVTFTGRITDSLISKRPGGKTSIYLTVSKYPFSHTAMQAVNNTIYEAEVKYNEDFSFRIVAPAKRFYIYIYYLQNTIGSDAINDLNWSGVDNVYIVDQGDNIRADLGKDNFQFSGKGADKFNCESEIYRNSFNGRKINSRVEEQLATLWNQGLYNERNTIMSRAKDSCLQLQKSVVNRYRNRLGKELSEIMLANCYGIRYYWELRGDRQLSDGNPAFFKAVINSVAYKKIGLGLSKSFTPQILEQAPIYCDFIFEKLRMDNYLEADGNHTIDKYYLKTYNDIKRNYKGILRDKLLALFFAYNAKYPTSMTYLDDAIKICGPSIYKEILISLNETQTAGKDFYPFRLPDVRGKMVKLADLNNKVVVLDFWYTGCENCIILHKNMEAIHNKFKNNPSVAFVSISIDRVKDLWVKSVNSAKYTDPGDINLYTEGQANKHPLMAKYSIASFPTVFILKNGKIFSSNPPRPDSEPINKGNTKKYVEVIEAALATKQM